jgi:UDP-N-acetylmuramoyl-L-alanyl-D-glutamate--2,6-diaminopimelate ligase
MHRLKKMLPQGVKNLYHLAQAVLANVIYGFPSRRLKVIGITGTNGKTTTTQMVAAILEEAGKKIAVASTINFKIGVEDRFNETKFTTLSPFAVQKFIKRAVEEECEYLVLETSSHSLDQHRVWGVEYKTAVMTNVTREHLDYHKTMATYRRAKLKLFQSAAVAIVNADMENPEEFLKLGNEQKITYGIRSQADVRAENVELVAGGSHFLVDGAAFKLNLLGDFNIENALAAICVGISEKITLVTCAQALEKIKGVAGRLESIPNKKGLNIIVDFALTPDALDKLYALVKRIKAGGKVIAVFGACGERDRGKRPIMGETVSRYADHVIITNEDPYSEDPQSIIDEVAGGVKSKIAGENFWKILDRREAIRKALALAKAGDFVLVTGKGHEKTMSVATGRIPWNDKEVILEELEKMP